MRDGEAAADRAGPELQPGTQPGLRSGSVPATVREPSAATAEPESRWQFSLRGMIVLTTAAAVSAAIAAARGAGSLVLSWGVILTVFNSAGYLRHWQTARWRPRWVYVGWLVFLTSMFLPSAKGCGHSPLVGWELSWTCVAVQYDAVSKVVTQADDRREFARQVAEEPARVISPHLMLFSITVANLVMLLAPVALLRWRQDRSRWLLGVLLVGTVFAWSISWPDGRDLLYGYYFWCAALALVLSSQRLPWLYVIVSWCQLALWLLIGDAAPVQ